MSDLIPRSYLFVPATNPQRFAKALAAGAGAVIVDLEDAVPPSQKTVARTAVADWVSADRPVLVRINAADTEWFHDDLALCGLPGVAGIVLPKAEVACDIEAVVSSGAAKVLPLIESARGFANVCAVAQAPGVQRLLFGSIDFKLDLGIDGDGEELLYFRSQLVLASRLAGIMPPVDGVNTAIDDAGQLTNDTLRARRIGFGGKLCIHPRQVSYVNTCFQPTPDDIAWAERILQAATDAQGAAVAVDGKMVDRPVMLKAQQILQESGRNF
ncbi:MAG TPA: CoA ester lyase [Eoetvoesiella sp.]